MTRLRNPKGPEASGHIRQEMTDASRKANSDAAMLYKYPGGRVKIYVILSLATFFLISLVNLFVK